MKVSIAAKPTCVVADDHPPVLESVSRFLGQQGFRVVGRARNGEEAIALVESQRPSVAVLDLRMPQMDGLELVRQFRADPDTAKIPLIVLSSGLMAERDPILRAAMRLQIGLSNNSQLVIATESGHPIQFDQPKLVIDAVQQVLVSARLGQPLRP